MERLPGKMLTQDQLLMLQSDNVVPDGAAGLEALGVDATPVELVVPAYLRRYAAGGEAAFKRTESDLIGRRSAE
jgi:NADH dehydrogenase